MEKNAIIACAVLIVAASALACPSDESESPVIGSIWTQIDGASVRYIDTASGSNLPAVLLIPDMPEFALSGAPTEQCGMEHYASFVDRFAQRLEPRSSSLTGSSMGSLILIRRTFDRLGPLEKRIADRTIRRLDGARHFIYLNASERVAELIEEFRISAPR